MIGLKHQLLLAVLLGLLSVGLLVLAVPRFVASLYALYPESVLSQTQAHLQAEAYQNSIKALDNALAWDNNPEYWQAKGLCYLALVKTPKTSIVERRLLLVDAKSAISNGLGGSPVDAFAWYRLALVNKMLGLEVVEALRLSLYAGRVEPTLVMPRLMLAYPYLSFFSAEEQAQWLKQVAIAWQFTQTWNFQPINLVSFVIENPSAKTWVESAFVNDVEQLNQFKYFYESAIKKTISAPVH